MKESYGEGLASHTGPESCGDGSNGMAEALTGVRAGRVLSREIVQSPGCRQCGRYWKATPGVSLSQDTPGPCAVGDLEHVRKHLTREPGDPIFASGKRVTEAASGSLRT